MAELDCTTPILDLVLSLGGAETIEGDCWNDIAAAATDLTGLTMTLEVAGGPVLPVEIYDAAAGLWRVQIEATHTGVQTSTSYKLWLIDGASRPHVVLRGVWHVV